MSDIHKAMRLHLLNVAMKRQVKCSDHGPEIELIPFSEQEPWLDVFAKEMIRQMKWARGDRVNVEMHHEYQGSRAIPVIDSIETPPLTIAPEEWQP